MGKRIDYRVADSANMKNPPVYVLVHGAWHGGWCWSRVADILLHAGHRVCAPTLTGLGEHSNLLSPTIGLETFIDDVCNVLRWRHLHNVILVGHSFGGLVAAGVADRMADRIAHLVFLDPFLLPPGKSAFDTLSADVVEKLEASVTQQGGLPPPRPTSFGLENEDDITFVADRLTAHPVGTYRDALSLQHPLGNGLPVTWLRCTRPPFAPVAQAHEWAHALFGSQWVWKDLDACHDAMVSAPGLVAQAISPAALGL